MTPGMSLLYRALTAPPRPRPQRRLTGVVVDGNLLAAQRYASGRDCAS